ncbi:MAG TPA: GNAT family N-acetyltransferase [Nocardioidaceae bacterium]|nr:GNAT family N-acetyltransferase [Nocardioidaceae bacterium]
MSELRHHDLAELPSRPWERSVQARLRDGGAAVLRPQRPGETDVLLAVLDGMSEESRALRYLTGLPRMPRRMLDMLCDVDGDRHVAWVASVDDEPAGIARYVRLPGDPTSAELAFEVVDAHHGRGLATVLLDTITTVASTRGVRRVQGTLAPSNTASRRLLARIGLETRSAGGLLEAEGPLRLLDPAVVDRREVVRVACTGAGVGDIALDIG